MTSSQVSPNDYGIRLATAEDVLRINAYAELMQWGARVSDAPLREGLSAEHKHLLLPLLRNGVSRSGEPQSLRCYAWLKRSAALLRVLTMLDVSVETISSLPRMTAAELEVVAFRLVEMQRLIDIDEWPFVGESRPAGD